MQPLTCPLGLERDGRVNSTSVFDKELKLRSSAKSKRKAPLSADKHCPFFYAPLFKNNKSTLNIKVEICNNFTGYISTCCIEKNNTLIF